MHYQKNERLTGLIENKRVVLVGPAQYLVGRGLGNAINEYDTVCRVNYMAPSNFVSDYGNRTDIMFYNCATLSLEQMEQHFEKYPDFTENLKLTVCPVVKGLGPDKWTEWPSDYIAPVVTNFNSINKYGIDFHWIGMSNYRYLFDVINCREPSSGPLSMKIILEHNPKEFFITGITFYLDGIENSYFKDYATEANGYRGPGHPQKKQIEFFKKCVLRKNVKIDSHLNSLLKIKHSNVKII